jgi:hypothetical protein
MGALLQILAALAVVALMTPAAIWLLGAARRHRGVAAGLGGLLLVFGVNAAVSPPPPPQVEAVEHEEETAGDDEPK